MSNATPSPAELAPERREQILQRLNTLQPTHIEVIDESHLHIGHEGSKDGAGHFRVIIASNQFKGMRPLARHRLVYEQVSDLIPYPVHALAIETRLNP